MFCRLRVDGLSLHRLMRFFDTRDAAELDAEEIGHDTGYSVERTLKGLGVSGHRVVCRWRRTMGVTKGLLATDRTNHAFVFTP